MTYSDSLIDWYLVNKRDLPWRKTVNPYFIWLSEIILQQTKVAQGLPYYEAFVSTYPTVFKLAKANEEEVLKLWQGLGYYSRARNLHATAKYVVNELKGEFPNNYKDLLKLKGVGDYTASAIASICFQEVCAVVDGNVYRALSRYFGISTAINSTEGKKEFKALAQKLIDKNQPALFNQAIMEFGAKQCKPKNPDCLACPLLKSCQAYQNNSIDYFPVKIKAAKPVKKYFNFLVIISQDGKTILNKRVGKGIWQNLYQFPLIESDNKLSNKTIQAQISSRKWLVKNTSSFYLYNQKPIIHKLSHQHLHTSFWILEVEQLQQGIPIGKILEYPVPKLISNFIEEFKL